VKPLAISAVCLSLLASLAGAAAPVPPTLTVAGKTLRLNGSGIRSRWFFKVYSASLYLETPTHNPDLAITSEQVKQIDLRMLRALDRSQIAAAITEGFQKNSGSQMGSLKSRLDRLNAMIPSVREGDQIALTYVPKKGTVVTAKGTEKGVIEGKDFAIALFAVWLGRSPVQDDLKTALLGG
jgi:hypothetical protein